MKFFRLKNKIYKLTFLTETKHNNKNPIPHQHQTHKAVIAISLKKQVKLKTRKNSKNLSHLHSISKPQSVNNKLLNANGYKKNLSK